MSGVLETIGGTIIYSPDPTDVTQEQLALELDSKADLVNELVPAEQLPSYVDDVINIEWFREVEPEFPSIGDIHYIPSTGIAYAYIDDGFITAWQSITLETGKIYINVDSESSELDSQYRWNGTNLFPIGNPNNTKIIATLTEEAEQLTGFAHPSDITTTWNSTTKIVTLTAVAGKLNAYWKGLPITGLTATDTAWNSPAIATLNTANKYFLYSKDGITIDWYADDMWTFGELQIAMVYYNGSAWVCTVETHGLMDKYTHEQLHYSLGTVLRSGGDISGLTLSSTTAADRRPSISQAVLADEDLSTTLPLLNKTTATPYTQFILTGAATQTISTGNVDIVSLSGNNPYYVTPLGVQTLFPNNHYGKIFVLAQPMANDVDSQKNRFVFFQPQQTSSTLSTIQGVTKESLVTGSLGVLLNEYNFIGEIIIRYIGANWQIISYSKLTGSKTSSASTPGGFLSSVTTDVTLTGNGTPSSPLGIPYRTLALADGNIDMTANPAEIYTRTASASQQFTILNPVIGKVFYLQMTGGTLNADLFASPMVETWILNALVTDYVPASTNILACQITSATTMKIFWTE